MNPRTLTFVGVGLIAVALWLGLRQRAETPALDPPRETPAEAPRRAESTLEKEAEVKRIKLRSAGEVVVRTVVKPRCGLGDMDGIKTELDHRSDKTLLLTLEPIDPGSVSGPQIHPATLADLTAGMKHAFPLDRKDSGMFGVFLCSDSTHVGRCQAKKTGDVGEILTKYGNPTEAQAKEVPEDHVYYFQFVFAKDGVASVFEKSNPSPGAHRKLGRLLSDESGRNADAIDSVLTEVQKRNHDVRSVAFDTETASDADVSIVLPQYNAEACQRKEPPPRDFPQIPKNPR